MTNHVLRCRDDTITSLNASKHGWRLPISRSDCLWRMWRRIGAWGPFLETNFTFCWCTKSWAAHQCDEQFGENKSIDIGKRQRLWKEGHARINKVSAMKPGQAMVIEKYVFHDILKVLKLTFVWLRMLAVLITLTPCRWNELIDCQKAKVCIAVLLIIDVKTCWNSTLKLLDCTYWLWEFTHDWLRHPKYTNYRPLFTTEDEWTIETYVMEVLRTFRYWTMLMLTWHPVTLRHVVSVYNDIFNHMDGVIQAVAKKKTPLEEDLFFTVKLAQQKPSKDYAEVTPTKGMLLISAHILDPFQKLRSFRRWEKGLDINAEDEASYTTQYQDEFPKDVENQYCAKHRRVPINKYECLQSSNLILSATASGCCQLSFDLYDSSSDDEEYRTPNNVAEITPGQRNCAARLLTAAGLSFNWPPEAPKNCWQLKPNLNDYHSDPMDNTSILWEPDITSVSYGSGIPGCGPGLEPDLMVGSGLLPGKPRDPADSGIGSNQTADALCSSYNFGSDWVFEFSLYCNTINMWNVQIDDLFHLPFSDLRSDQYSLCCFEIKPNITPKWLGFHRDSATIDPIANRGRGDERGHQTAYFTYRLCRDTMSTPILIWSKKWWLLRRGFRVGTRCNSPVPGQNWNKNRTGNFDLSLILEITDWSHQQVETHSKDADPSNVPRDIFAIIPHGVWVEASSSHG